MSDDRQTSKIKKLWSIVAILVLGLIFIVAASLSSRSDKTVSQLGSKGNDIFLIQQRLAQLGFYDGEENGVFDLETQKALLKFQRKNGLDDTGIADEETRKKLGLGRTNLSEYSDTELLARFIEWKAGNSNYIDMVTAGAIVLNRMADDRYPDTVAGIVFQNGEFDGFATAVYKTEPTQSALKATDDCLSGTDPTGGKTDF